MKMNVMVKTLLVGGVCIASIACQSNQSAQTTEVVEQKPKVTTEVATLQDVEQVLYGGCLEQELIRQERNEVLYLCLQKLPSQ